MKLFASGLLGLLCVFANASEGEWKRVSATESILATKPDEIQDVLLKNPEILGYNSGTFFENAAATLSGVGDKVLLKLQVKRRTWVWEGATVCPKGDPRLTTKSVFASTAGWSGGGLEFEGGELAPLPGDPCARR